MKKAEKARKKAEKAAKKEKKKAEKEKQREKERKEAAKQKEKEEKQSKAKLIGEAARIASKLSPVIAGLHESFSHSKANLLPDQVSSKSKGALEKMEEMVKACNAITVNGSTKPLTFTMDEVNEQHKEGARGEQLFNHRRASPLLEP